MVIVCYRFSLSVADPDPHCFSLITTTFDLALRAPKEKEAELWKQNIQACITDSTGVKYVYLNILFLSEN